MITPRTLAMFHFGFALVFLVVGGFFMFILHFSQPKPMLARPPQGYEQTIRQSIVQDQNLESLRSMALLYYDQSRLLMQALSGMGKQFVDSVLYFFGFAVFAFVLGGVMSLRVKSP